jgi:hypothetical protein
MPLYVAEPALSVSVASVVVPVKRVTVPVGMPPVGVETVTFIAVVAPCNTLIGPDGSAMLLEVCEIVKVPGVTLTE